MDSGEPEKKKKSLFNSEKWERKVLIYALLNMSTHPPTPVVFSLEYGALSGSIAVTSFFLGSFFYSPEEADKVFPSQVFLEESRVE